jgi:hypothetical protein
MFYHKLNLNIIQKYLINLLSNKSDRSVKHLKHVKSVKPIKHVKPVKHLKHTISIKKNDSKPVDLKTIESVESDLEQLNKRNEIINYHDKMLLFNENINRSSGGLDTVDKLNQLCTGDNLMEKLNGKSISDIYDKLTQNN